MASQALNADFMLEVGSLRKKKEEIKQALRKRMLSADVIEAIDEVVKLDEQRRDAQTQLDQLKAMVNRSSKEIGQLFREGREDEAQKARASVGEFKEEISVLEAKMREAEEQMEIHLLNIPNVPHDSVPAGKSEEDNEVYREQTGTIPDLPSSAQPHWELGEKYNIIDLKLGAKLTGSGFPVYRGKGARLERALINYFLDKAREAGYEEVQPPLLVNADTARATGQLPDKEGQMYHVEKDGLYLIPTAEVPLTNIYRDEILEESDLPVRIAGYTPCFRREAGSYGADVKGLNRVHQFDKVEIIQIAHPERSYEVLGQMVDHVASLLESLELPYRILRLCGGDLGFTSALTFDFEVYSAAQKKWLEVSSVSNFETFQSNRLNLRFRDGESRKTRLAHTLNGSALALARIVAALLENNQQPGKIVIPAVLRAYTGFDIIEN